MHHYVLYTISDPQLFRSKEKAVHAFEISKGDTTLWQGGFTRDPDGNVHSYGQTFLLCEK